MKVNLNLSILYWLNLPKMDKDGKAPIYCRLTLDNKRTQFSTGKKVSPDSWERKAGKVKGNSTEVQMINEDLESLKGDIRKIFNQLSATNSVVTGTQIKHKLTGEEDVRKSVLELFKLVKDLYLNKYKQGKAALKTWQRFQTVTTKIERFIKFEYGTKDKLLAHIDFSFGENLHHFLQIQESLTDNTINKYIKISSQVFDVGIRKGWLIRNPLCNVKSSYKPPNIEKLSMIELEKLINCETKNERLTTVRDAFIFSCYTGYAYVDTFNLTTGNVIIGIDGNKWISTKRQKNDEPELVPLLPPALSIIEKYKNDPYCIANNKLLPLCSNQKYNQYLKEVARLAGITKNLTTHMARHTFATSVLLDHDVPLETVSKLLGHSSIKTTQIYAKVSLKKLSNNMNELKNKLFKEEINVIANTGKAQ